VRIKDASVKAESVKVGSGNSGKAANAKEKSGFSGNN
jgi:hypothetical protein